MTTLQARLRGLRRDTGTGLLVPWVAEWGGCHTVGEDPVYGKVDRCDCRPGQGVPRFKEFCLERHRRGIDGRLCQLCGQPFTPDEPYVFVAGAGTTDFKDPPAHPGCARYALRVCPGLARHMPKLQVITCRDYAVKILLRTPEICDTLTLAQRRLFPQQVVRWLYAVPERPQRHTPADWLEHMTRRSTSATVGP